MSRLDELARDLAPHGVTHRPLGAVGEFIRGNGLQKSDLTQSGFPAIHYGQVHTYYRVRTKATKSFTTLEKAAKLRRAKTGDLIIATTSEDDEAVGKATAWLGESEVAVSGDAYIYRHHLEPRFVAYFFKSEQFQSQKTPYLTGTKVRRISGDALSRIVIPVPPLKIQREIVRILDKFTQLEAELEAELEARRQQYHHYRSLVLAQSRLPGQRTARLREVAEFRRGTAITADQAVPGDVPVVANGPTSTYTHNASNRSGETVVIARSGAYSGYVSFWKTPIFLTDAFSVHPNQKMLTPKFLYYWLQAEQDSLHQLKQGAGVPHVRVKEVEERLIYLPPLAVQERVADALDKFDALVNDLSIGLPAELAARRKQYEHYRDKLLTFEEAPVE